MKTTLIRRRLIRRRNQLFARYRAELERADELDEKQPEDIERATEQWDAKVLSKLGEVDAQALFDVVSAIRRIDSGTYGTCVECGDEIPTDRLDAMPATATCIECAGLAEQPTTRMRAVR